MNWLSFIDLLRIIYNKDNPDLDKIQNKGLLAVKIGQTYALRIDFLRPQTCKHLAQLYRNTLKLPSEEIRKLINDYMSPDKRRRLVQIDERPLASASVGQIHRARLEGKEEVVVKVIKKNVTDEFKKDVHSVRSFLRFILFVYPVLRKVADPMGILNHIESYTLRELNLLNEIQGQKILKEIYDEYKNKFDLTLMEFPHVYEELSSERIMISEYIPGKTFDELLEEGDMPYELLLELFKLHGCFMFGKGTFHGDIHPGNIMLYKNKLYFIDTGAISTVPDTFRVGLFNFFDALTLYDYEQCTYRIEDMSVKKLDKKSFMKFQDKFYELYRDFKDSRVGEVSLTRKMMESIKLAVRSGMEFETGIFAIIKSLMYLDGMVLKCKPDTILVKDLRQFIPAFKNIM